MIATGPTPLAERAMVIGSGVVESLHSTGFSFGQSNGSMMLQHEISNEILLKFKPRSLKNYHHFCARVLDVVK